MKLTHKQQLKMITLEQELDIERMEKIKQIIDWYRHEGIYPQWQCGSANEYVGEKENRAANARSLALLHSVKVEEALKLPRFEQELKNASDIERFTTSAVGILSQYAKRSIFARSLQTMHQIMSLKSKYGMYGRFYIPYAAQQILKRNGNRSLNYYLEEYHKSRKSKNSIKTTLDHLKSAIEALFTLFNSSEINKFIERKSINNEYLKSGINILVNVRNGISHEDGTKEKDPEKFAQTWKIQAHDCEAALIELINQILIMPELVSNWKRWMQEIKENDQTGDQILLLQKEMVESDKDIDEQEEDKDIEFLKLLNDQIEFVEKQFLEAGVVFTNPTKIAEIIKEQKPLTKKGEPRWSNPFGE